MREGAQAELDALRKLIEEATSKRPDGEISMGALLLRKKFEMAAMDRLDELVKPKKGA